MRKKIIIIISIILLSNIFLCACIEDSNKKNENLTVSLLYTKLNSSDLKGDWYISNSDYKNETYIINETASPLYGFKILESYTIRYNLTDQYNFVEFISIKFESTEVCFNAYANFTNKIEEDYPEIKSNIIGDDSYLGEVNQPGFSLKLLIFRISNVFISIHGILPDEISIINIGEKIEERIRYAINNPV